MIARLLWLACVLLACGCCLPLLGARPPDGEA
jgi:hypothetical protein